MYARTSRFRALQRLADDQRGACSRPQLLELGIDAERISREIAQERWSTWGPHVVLLQNSAPVLAQVHFAAVLHAGPHAALTGVTALRELGFTGFDSQILHVVVPRGVKVPHLEGLKVHELRRYSLADRHPVRLPAQVMSARAAVDAAVLQPHPRYAGALVAAVVQQRIATPGQIRAVLDASGQVRHRLLLSAQLTDIAGGSETIGELELLRACRQAGIEVPHRQVMRRDATGRARYRDAEWDLADGSVLVLEVDGAHHMQVGHWEADVARSRGDAAAGRRVLRCTNLELRLRPKSVTADLIAAGVPRLVSRRAG